MGEYLVIAGLVLLAIGLWGLLTLNEKKSQKLESTIYCGMLLCQQEKIEAVKNVNIRNLFYEVNNILPFVGPYVSDDIQLKTSKIREGTIFSSAFEYENPLSLCQDCYNKFKLLEKSNKHCLNILRGIPNG